MQFLLATWGLNKAFTVPNLCRALIFVIVSDSEPRIIFKLLLYLRENIFQSLSMLYYILKLSKILYFVSIMQKVHLKAEF